MREWIAAFARKAGNYVPDAAASARRPHAYEERLDESRHPGQGCDG